MMKNVVSLRKFHIGFLIMVTLYAMYIIIPRSTPEEIVQNPNSHLRGKSEKVTFEDPEIHKIAEKLKIVLKKIDRPLSFITHGMAAPQLGYDKRIIALKKSYGNYEIMVNPEMVEKEYYLPAVEGCFSVEGIHFTKRYYWVKLQYQDVDGNSQERILRGIPAITLQQEIDHLDGILITDFE